MSNQTLQFGSKSSSSFLDIKPPPDLGKYTKQTNQGTDFVATVNDMVEKVKKDGGKSDATIVIDPLSLPNISGDLEIVKKLKEINQWIKEEKYQQSIDALLEVLKKDPYRHEATYLLAYCYSMLKRNEDALKTLRHLDDVRLESDLDEKVQTLQETIRVELRGVILIENLMLLLMGHFDKAVERVKYFITLDPTNTVLYFLAAGTLVKGQRMKEALDIIETGIDKCNHPSKVAAASVLAINLDSSKQNPDLVNLHNFRNFVVKQYVMQLMEPARQSYKNSNYGRAYKQLQSAVPQRYQGVEVYRLFDAYLQELKPTGFLFKKSPSLDSVHLQGTIQQQEEFYDFLVGREIYEAQQLSQVGRYRDSQLLVSTAVKMAPNYPYINYIYAGMLFSGMLEGLVLQSISLQDMTRYLEIAEQCAAVGMRDKEIPDAKDLKDLITNALAQLRLSAVVAPHINAHQSVINELNQGKLNANNLPTYQKRLDRIKTDIAGAKRGQSVQIGNILDGLIKQIDNDLLTLDAMSVIMRFNTTMKDLERRLPKLSQRDATDFKNQFRAIQSDNNKLLMHVSADFPGRDQLLIVKSEISKILA